MVPAFNDAREFLSLFLQIQRRLLPCQLVRLLGFAIGKLDTVDIGRCIKCDGALLTIDLGRGRRSKTLALIDLDSESGISEGDEAAGVDTRRTDIGSVGLGLGLAEEGNGKGNGIDADVDEAAAGEVEAEDVGDLAGKHVVVARAVSAVGQTRSEQSAEFLLVNDELAEELEVCFLNVAEGLDEEDVVFLCESEEGVKFGDGRGGGFLYDDMFLRSKQSGGVVVVVRIGRGDVDGLDGGVGSETVDGGVDCFDAILVCEGPGCIFSTRIDGRELPFPAVLGRVDEGVCDPIGADDAEAEHDGRWSISGDWMGSIYTQVR